MIKHIAIEYVLAGFGEGGYAVECQRIGWSAHIYRDYCHIRRA